MLVAAMLAPAILASGLLMADFTGYGERARNGPAYENAGEHSRAAMRAGGHAQPEKSPIASGTASAAARGGSAALPGDGAGRLAVVRMAGALRAPLLDPTPVPEPSGPARVYEGLVRLLPVIHAVRQVVPRSVPAPRRPKEAPPEHRDTAPTCSPEWRDTWLWELCRERGLEAG